MLDLSDFPEKVSTLEDDIALSVAGNLEGLVLCSMREAFKYGHRCARGNLEDREVLSACYLALRDAAKNFKPGETRFFAYAKPYVRGKIIAEFKRQRVVKNSEGNVNIIAIIDESCPEAREERFHDCPRVPHRILPEEEVPLFPMSVSPENNAGSDEWNRIKTLVAGVLNEEEKMTLELRYRGDLTFDKIGELIGKSKTWAATLHATAMRKIREELTRQKISRATL